MTAYYNEIDPKAAAWLRELIAQGHIAAGEVDERDIRDVAPDELVRFTQCHFFAGIGGWSYALRLAGWPDDRPVWTFSEPCQPFSAAGKRGGAADERYMRPFTHHLVSVCRPDVCFGEQVASKDGLDWLDTLQADMEAAGYAGGAVDLCAAGIGAPHIRQRQWFVFERLADTQGRKQPRLQQEPNGKPRTCGEGMPDRGRSDTGRMVNGEQPRLEGHGGMVRPPGPTNSLWRAADWLFCRDGKWRPVEPGTFPLVDGLSGRVGLLRGYGNAINPWAAKEVIEAYLDIKSEVSVA